MYVCVCVCVSPGVCSCVRLYGTYNSSFVPLMFIQHRVPESFPLVSSSSSPSTPQSPDSSHPLEGIPVVQPARVSAVLVPVGLGVGPADRAEFGQCLCLDWFPSNRECRVAAGFSNGNISHE